MHSRLDRVELKASVNEKYIRELSHGSSNKVSQHAPFISFNKEQVGVQLARLAQFMEETAAQGIFDLEADSEHADKDIVSQ